MKITLPHLPHNIDRRAYYLVKDFIVSPKHIVLPFSVKNVDMDTIKKKNKYKPINLSTIFGVVRTE